MFAIGNDELEGCKDLKSGSRLKCNVCGKICVVKDSTPKGIMFIVCKKCGKSYLVGIDGKNIHDRFKQKVGE